MQVSSRSGGFERGLEICVVELNPKSRLNCGGQDSRSVSLQKFCKFEARDHSFVNGVICLTKRHNLEILLPRGKKCGQVEMLTPNAKTSFSVIEFKVQARSLHAQKQGFIWLHILE